jgi:hypothetical protein
VARAAALGGPAGPGTLPFDAAVVLALPIVCYFALRRRRQ